MKTMILISFLCIMAYPVRVATNSIYILTEVTDFTNTTRSEAEIEGQQYCEELDEFSNYAPAYSVPTTSMRYERVQVSFNCDQEHYQCGERDATGVCQSDKTWKISGSLTCIGKTQVIDNPKPNHDYFFDCELAVGAKVMITGYPTNNMMFGWNFKYNGTYEVMINSYRFSAAGDYRKIVLNDHSKLRGYGTEQRISYFPFKKDKVFKILIERIPGGYAAFDLISNKKLYTFKRGGSHNPRLITLGLFSHYKELKITYP